jgi:hypothetical protein
MFTQARAVIGGEALAIGGGTTVSAVFAEVDNGREYEEGGFDKARSLDAVVQISDWSAAYAAAASSYLGKTATARGLTFRVTNIREGAAFVIVRLTEPSKS